MDVLCKGVIYKYVIDCGIRELIGYKWNILLIIVAT